MNSKNYSPLISVVIPTINRGELLKNAIASVDAQTYKNIEIIIVDDFSDNQIPISYYNEKFKSLKIVLTRNVQRMGGAASRNIGIEKSNGSFVCFLDDDDVYMPNKIQLLLDALNKTPNAGAAFGKIKLHDGSHYIKCFNEIKAFNFRENIVLMNMIHNNSTLIKREVLSNVKFLESLTRYQDLQFNIELSLKAQIIFVDDFVAEWRVDARSDRISNVGDLKKMNKDAIAFSLVYKYLRSELNVSNENLILFKLKLFKMLLAIGQLTNALKIIFSDCSIFNIRNIFYALRLRNRYWNVN